MTPLHVRYDGRQVGRLAQAEVSGRACLFFEYDPAFVAAGIELSPLHLPLRNGLLSRDGGRPVATETIARTQAALDRWSEFADEAGVPADVAGHIGRQLAR